MERLKKLIVNLVKRIRMKFSKQPKEIEMVATGFVSAPKNRCVSKSRLRDN